MKTIRRILLSILGEKKYLSLLAANFQRIYKTGRLGKQYQDIYFLKNIVREGDYCVDIGAHLGYYTLELSRLAGPKGRVFAVEPMSSFHDTLGKLLKNHGAGNVTLHQVALGGSGDWVEMGIPTIGNMKKFGYARVMGNSTHLEYVETERVKNESGDRLFKQLPRVDFIKIDVEELEVSVVSSLMETLKTHHPVLLCELADKEERIKLYEMIMELGYQAYLLESGQLRLLDIYSDKKAVSHNHYFIHQSREAYLIDILSD